MRSSINAMIGATDATPQAIPVASSEGNKPSPKQKAAKADVGNSMGSPISNLDSAADSQGALAPRQARGSWFGGSEADPKAEDHLTDSFFGMQAQVNKLQSQMDEVYRSSQSQQRKVEDVLLQLKTLIELQANEVRKGIGRDAEIKAMSEELYRMKNLVNETIGDQILMMNQAIGDLRAGMTGVGEKIKGDMQGELEKRDDLVYRIEADISDIKTSFTSLRLEVQKHHRGMDFKCVGEYIKLYKAFDDKPDERKTALRELQTREEKLRGAVQRTEQDMKALEDSMKQQQVADPGKPRGQVSTDPLSLVNDPASKKKGGRGQTNI